MAHFERVGYKVSSPRLNNNGCQDWHNAHSRKSLNCKMVQRSSELLTLSRCVSWFIVPADQILQWTWKKKMSRIGSSFQSSSKPRSTLYKFIWLLHLLTKQSEVPPANSWWRSLQMQRNLWEAGDRVRLTSSECQDAWLPVRMEKQNITISDKCPGFRAQFNSPRSEFIYDIIEISHALEMNKFS